MIKINLEEVRKRYPKPRSSHDVDGPAEADCYCVGGGCCLYLDPFSPHFPSITHLADKLDISMKLSYIIIRLNDAGKFDKAWERLETEQRRCYPNG